MRRGNGTMVVEQEGCIMKIAMANDQAGTALKNQIKEWLEAQGHEVVDFGTYDEEGCDLSDFVYPAAQADSTRGFIKKRR